MGVKDADFEYIRRLYEHFRGHKSPPAAAAAAASNSTLASARIAAIGAISKTPAVTAGVTEADTELGMSPQADLEMIHTNPMRRV